MDLSNLSLEEHKDIKREQKELNKLYKEKFHIDMDCVSIIDYVSSHDNVTINDLHEELGLCKSSIYIKVRLLDKMNFINRLKQNTNMYTITIDNKHKVSKLIKNVKSIIDSRSLLVF